MHHHRRLQKRVFIGTCIVAVIAAIIAIPLILLEDERYQLAMDLNLIPGKDAVWLSDAEDGAELLVVPVAIGNPHSATDWLMRAQFIAWPNAEGMELEHLDTHERKQIPLASIGFASANDDGSILLLRGPDADSGDEMAITVEPESMTVKPLPRADSVPDSPGDWETPSWQKNDGLCTRVSEHRRFVGCFTRAAGASYLAGDWQLDLQLYADYTQLHPLYRGQGFLPWIGFAEQDTVVYLQNERGIVRIDIPEDVLDAAPPGTPYRGPEATPATATHSSHRRMTTSL